MLIKSFCFAFIFSGDLFDGFRLVDGSDTTERPDPYTGRLQVRLFSHDKLPFRPYDWMDVCAEDINDDKAFASYACKELGYTDGEAIYYDMPIHSNVTVSDCGPGKRFISIK